MALIKLDFDGFINLENRLKLQTFYIESPTDFKIFMFLEGQTFGTEISITEINRRYGTSPYVLDLFKATYIRDAIKIESLDVATVHIEKGEVSIDTKKLEEIIQNALAEISSKLTTTQSGGPGTAGYALIPVSMGSGKPRRCMSCGNIILSTEDKCPACGSEKIDSKEVIIEMKKWIGWDFEGTVKWILKFLETYTMSQITDVNKKQKTSIKEALIKSLTEGWTLNKLEYEIEAVVEDGDKARVIARTEIIRAANEGAILHYKDQNIEKVRWIAVPSAPGGRTCDRCLERHGREYLMKDAEGKIPLHPFCRCTWTPIV